MKRKKKIPLEEDSEVDQELANFISHLSSPVIWERLRICQEELESVVGDEEV